MSDSVLFDTDSEEEMPPGWEEKLTDDGKIFYVNHNLKETQWGHPRTGLIKKISEEMPYGWKKEICKQTGKEIFCNSRENRTSEIDPRLAFPESTEESINSERVRQRFDGSSTAVQVLQGRDLTGLHAIVTGGNSGIGYETAKSLASFGATVIIGCRNMKKANEAVKRIRASHPPALVSAIFLDLTCLNTVDSFVETYAKTYQKVNMLILNAGSFWIPYDMTPDGFETTFQTNYLGHFHLVRQLKKFIFACVPSRIVFVSAESHRFTDLKYETICEGLLSPPSPHMYHPILAYNLSKMCLMLLCYELHQRWYPYGVQCFAVHPGNMIYTNLCRNYWLWKFLFFLVSPFSKTQQQGAACTVYCATARELRSKGGCYFVNCFQTEPSPEALNLQTSSLLWHISRNMISKAATLKDVVEPKNSHVYTCRVSLDEMI